MKEKPNMYRVVIIDDESPVRNRLRLLIDWEHYGFTIVGEAADGEDGLQLIQQLVPDVIITDIRMPVISGLELIRMVNENVQISPLFVILSGYSDFSYAHSAMKYGIKHYLLKPTDEQELIEIVGQLNQELESRQESNMAFIEGQKVLQEKGLRNLFHYPNSQELLDPIIRSRVGRSKTFRVILIELDGFVSIPLEEGKQLRDHVDDLLNELMPPIGTVEESVGQYIALVCNLPDDENDIQRIADNVISSLQDRTGYTAYITLGQLVNSLEQIHESYITAISAFEAKLIVENNRVILYERIKKYLGETSWTSIALWNNEVLLQAIEFNEVQQVQDETSSLFNLVRNSEYSPEQLKGMLTESMLQLIRLVNRNQGDMARIVGECFSLKREMDSKSSMSELERWFKDICLKASQHLNEIRRFRPRKVSQEIIQYIESHYNENITLKMIAETIYMNPVYLGQIFKNDTGLTFNDCLTEVRVREAVKLLKETELPVYKIAELVGYRATGNLYKVFKKVEGCNPVDYRNRNMQNSSIKWRSGI
jgi:two-component system response regulator YesN